MAIRRKSLPLPIMKWIENIKPIIHHKKVAMPSPEEMERFAAEGKMVLRTEDLVKKYGQRTVANHVSINVRQGEIVGLLGPNGAGKTTTFYMTTGLITPNEGRIFLNDLDITSFPVYRRAQYGIGYLAQEASVFRKLSVEDNLIAVLQMTGKSKEYQKEKLEKYCDTTLEMNSVSEREAFASGFRIALRLACAALADKTNE